MRKGGSAFSLVTIIASAAFALMALYWLAAIAFVAVVLLWNVVSWLTAKIFHRPMEKLAIPAALKLQIGRSRLSALFGLVATILCVGVSAAVITDFHEPAVRRIGQGLSAAVDRLGEFGDKLEMVAGEGIGYKRIERWSDWIWADDVTSDDTEFIKSKRNSPLPAALFDFSAKVNGWGWRLEERVFEGERHLWFTCAYWFLVAVFLPFLVATFLVTVFQMSARRLTAQSGFVMASLQGIATILVCYCLFAAFYLLPYVSHPYHSIGVPFWIATVLYVLAASICCGVARANQDVLFSPEFHPDSAASADTGRRG